VKVRHFRRPHSIWDSRGVTLFQKVGYQFRFVEEVDRAPKARESRRWRRRRGGVRGGVSPGFPPPRRGWGLRRGLCPRGKFFISYSRKGAFWWIPDAFWRTNFEVVVCCAQDVARLCDRFSPIGCSSWGLSSPIPLSPDRLPPCLSPFSSHPSPSIPFSSFSSPSSPNWRGVHTLRMFTVHCNAHYGPTPQPFHTCMWYVWKSKFRTTVKAYLQCMLRDSYCYFSAMCLISGGTVTPTPKSGGTRTLRTPRELRLCETDYKITHVCLSDSDSDLSYGHNSYSILMKLCTVVCNPKSKIGLIRGWKSDQSLPHFHPRNALSMAVV